MNGLVNRTSSIIWNVKYNRAYRLDSGNGVGLSSLGDKLMAS